MSENHCQSHGMGQVRTCISHVHQNRKTSTLYHIIHRISSRIINGKTLEVRMQFYAVQVQLLQLLKILFQILRCRMKCSKCGAHGIRCLTRCQKRIDRMHLCHGGCRRANQKPIDSRSPPIFQHLGNSPVVFHGKMIKCGDTICRFLCNFIRKNMRM